jgi:hypothetical protein
MSCRCHHIARGTGELRVTSSGDLERQVEVVTLVGISGCGTDMSRIASMFEMLPVATAYLQVYRCVVSVVIRQYTLRKETSPENTDLKMILVLIFGELINTASAILLFFL